MGWRRTIRRATDQGVKYSGLLRACERGMRSKITVLMYHRVLEDAACVDYPFPSLVMPRSLFQAQVELLAERTRVLPVSDALSQLHHSSPKSKPLVCLTFDDGYVDNFEIAAPVLEAQGLRGTFFITAGAVEAQKPLWYDRAAAIWPQLCQERPRQWADERGDVGMPDFSTRELWIALRSTVSPSPQPRSRSMSSRPWSASTPGP